MSISKSKYRSLFTDIVGPVRRTARTKSTAAKHGSVRRAPGPVPVPAPVPRSPVSNSASSSSSSLGSANPGAPLYATAYLQAGQRSQKMIKVYPKPEGNEVLSVTIRLRGDYDGEILTTTARFHAYDGLQNQIQSTLLKNFGKGAIGIATPRGKVITEDWQIYQLAYPGASTTFCNVVYAREDHKSHPPILVRATKLLLEVNRKDFNSSKSGMFMYLDPNEGYDTTYIDQARLTIIPPEEAEFQKDIAIRKGYYYKDVVGLPSYDEISVFRFGNACFSADCGCCQGWIRSQSQGAAPQRSRRQNTRWRGIELQDYDGLTLAQRRYLVSGEGSN